MCMASLWTYLLLRQAIDDLRNLMFTAGSRHGEPTATLAHPAENQRDTVRTSRPTERLGLEHVVEHSRGYVWVNSEGEIRAGPPTFTSDHRLGAQEECQPLGLQHGSPSPMNKRDPAGAQCCLQPEEQEQVSGPQVNPGIHVAVCVAEVTSLMSLRMQTTTPN